jgi:hypothetical protein
MNTYRKRKEDIRERMQYLRQVSSSARATRWYEYELGLRMIKYFLLGTVFGMLISWVIFLAYVAYGSI